MKSWSKCSPIKAYIYSINVESIYHLDIYQSDRYRTAMLPGRLNHASFKVNEDEVEVGDLVFVPEGDEIFKGLTNAPPKELKDHLALIIELFEGKAVDNSYAWLLQVHEMPGYY